jgi:hypothetical protein
VSWFRARLKGRPPVSPVVGGVRPEQVVGSTEDQLDERPSVAEVSIQRATGTQGASAPQRPSQGVVAGDYRLHAFAGTPPRALCGAGTRLTRIGPAFDPSAPGGCPDCAVRARRSSGSRQQQQRQRLLPLAVGHGWSRQCHSRKATSARSDRSVGWFDARRDRAGGRQRLATTKDAHRPGRRTVIAARAPAQLVVTAATAKAARTIEVASRRLAAVRPAVTGCTGSAAVGLSVITRWVVELTSHEA